MSNCAANPDAMLGGPLPPVLPPLDESLLTAAKFPANAATCRREAW